MCFFRFLECTRNFIENSDEDWIQLKKMFCQKCQKIKYQCCIKKKYSDVYFEHADITVIAGKKYCSSELSTNKKI